jgi:hypothetical protein
MGITGLSCTGEDGGHDQGDSGRSLQTEDGEQVRKLNGAPGESELINDLAQAALTADGMNSHRPCRKMFSKHEEGMRTCVQSVIAHAPFLLREMVTMMHVRVCSWLLRFFFFCIILFAMLSQRNEVQNKTIYNQTQPCGVTISAQRMPRLVAV